MSYGQADLASWHWWGGDEYSAGLDLAGNGVVQPQDTGVPLELHPATDPEGGEPGGIDAAGPGIAEQASIASGAAASGASAQAAYASQGLDLLHQYCFFDDEPVFFTGGEPKNIRLVETGAMVDAADQFDPNGKIGSYRVVKRFDNGLRQPLYLHLHDEFGNTATTRVTTNHEYWVPARGWIAAGELRIGDRLRSRDGREVWVSDKFQSDEWLPTYNLCVEGAHTFFVGQIPVLVHNASKDELPQYGAPPVNQSATPIMSGGLAIAGPTPTTQFNDLNGTGERIRPAEWTDSPAFNYVALPILTVGALGVTGFTAKASAPVVGEFIIGEAIDQAVEAATGMPIPIPLNPVDGLKDLGKYGAKKLAKEAVEEGAEKLAKDAIKEGGEKAAKEATQEGAEKLAKTAGNEGPNGGPYGDVRAPNNVDVRQVGGRNPINSKYAGQTYPVEKLPADLQTKYPNSVKFTQEGFPNFSPYAEARVKLNGLTGDYAKDAAMANKAAGLAETPGGYVWHHVEDGKTMMLVPKDLHDAVRHTGGSAVIRHGEVQP